MDNPTGETLLTNLGLDRGNIKQIVLVKDDPDSTPGVPVPPVPAPRPIKNEEFDKPIKDYVTIKTIIVTWKLNTIVWKTDDHDETNKPPLTDEIVAILLGDHTTYFSFTAQLVGKEVQRSTWTGLHIQKTFVVFNADGTEWNLEGDAKTYTKNGDELIVVGGWPTDTENKVEVVAYFEWSYNAAPEVNKLEKTLISIAVVDKNYVISVEGDQVKTMSTTQKLSVFTGDKDTLTKNFADITQYELQSFDSQTANYTIRENQKVLTFQKADVRAVHVDCSNIMDVVSYQPVPYSDIKEFCDSDDVMKKNALFSRIPNAAKLNVTSETQMQMENQLCDSRFRKGLGSTIVVAKKNPDGGDAGIVPGNGDYALFLRTTSAKHNKEDVQTNLAKRKINPEKLSTEFSLDLDLSKQSIYTIGGSYFVDILMEFTVVVADFDDSDSSNVKYTREFFTYLTNMAEFTLASEDSFLIGLYSKINNVKKKTDFQYKYYYNYDNAEIQKFDNWKPYVQNPKVRKGVVVLETVAFCTKIREDPKIAASHNMGYVVAKNPMYTEAEYKRLGYLDLAKPRRASDEFSIVGLGSMAVLAFAGITLMMKKKRSEDREIGNVEFQTLGEVLQETA